ncbi:major facilitator superfamily domain-containing protein [Xylaria telfairii]|nr:major facilitator superfamily domain-containing protein [Xylaria telfairii]
MVAECQTQSALGVDKPTLYECSPKDAINGASPQPSTTPDTAFSLMSAGQEDQDVKNQKSLAFYLALLALVLNVFLYALDATTLGVAIPAIVAELGGSTLESFWATIAYLLAVLVTQPLFATVSSFLGRKIPLFVASAFFFVGSLIFALAHDMTQVIVGRVLQGLGGSGLDVLSEIIVTDMTSLKERPLYLGLMALPTVVGTILGPSLGGIFSTFASWRWIGWFNLPVLGVSSTLSLFFLHLRPLEGSRLPWSKRLDWVGMPLFAGGITLFALPISWAGIMYSWSSWPTILLLLIGATLLGIFVVYEQWLENPMIPCRIFHSRTASMTFFGAFLHGASLFSLLQWLPLLYQAVPFETVLQSAVTLLPTSIASVISAAVGVIVVGVVGKGYRWSISFSWALTAVGSGLLILLDEHSSAAFRGGIPVLWGSGVGLLLRLLFLANQANVPRVDDTDVAIGALLTFRLFGGLLGIAACSSIFNSLFTFSITANGPYSDLLTPLKDPNQAIRFIPTLGGLDLPEDILFAIKIAYLTPIRAIFYFMTGVGGLGFISSLFIKDIDLEKTEMGEQRFNA